MKIEYRNGQQYRDGKPHWWVSVEIKNQKLTNQTFWISADTLDLAKTEAKTRYCNYNTNPVQVCDLVVKGGKFVGGGA